MPWTETPVRPGGSGGLGGTPTPVPAGRAEGGPPGVRGAGRTIGRFGGRTILRGTGGAGASVAAGSSGSDVTTAVRAGSAGGRGRGSVLLPVAGSALFEGAAGLSTILI